MQWIYLFLFTLTLLVPQLIRPDFPLTGNHENFESAAMSRAIKYRHLKSLIYPSFVK